jgi:hydroxyacylglutathione hydrolase
MFFRQFLNDDTACASYLFGCKTHGEFAVVDAHADLVDDYLAGAQAQGSKITAVIETHIQADHVSGLPELVQRTGATAYMPEGSGAKFPHRALADGELIELGNTVVEALATPGHAPAHHSYLVRDHRRGEEPWLVLTGDSLLVGDVGRPDLHAASEESVQELARELYRSLHARLLSLPDHILVYPGHYAGSVCGRGLSGHPASSIGFERRNNRVLAAESEDAFVEAVLREMPPAPERQAEIVAANRSGESSAALT